MPLCVLTASASRPQFPCLWTAAGCPHPVRCRGMGSVPLGGWRVCALGHKRECYRTSVSSLGTLELKNLRPLVNGSLSSTHCLREKNTVCPNPSCLTARNAWPSKATCQTLDISLTGWQTFLSLVCLLCRGSLVTFWDGPERRSPTIYSGLPMGPTHLQLSSQGNVWGVKVCP